MSALLMYAAIAVAGIILVALIAPAARREVETAELAWTTPAPCAETLGPVADLMAFGVTQAPGAPLGAVAVVRAYCSTASGAVDDARRWARLERARGLSDAPQVGWPLMRVSLRLHLMRRRVERLAHTGRRERLADLAPELRRLHVEVRTCLDAAVRLPASWVRRE